MIHGITSKILIFINSIISEGCTKPMNLWNIIALTLLHILNFSFSVALYDRTLINSI
jgi:hypothetical protein